MMVRSCQSLATVTAPRQVLPSVVAEEGAQGVQLHPHPKTWGCKHIFRIPKNIEGALHGKSTIVLESL